MFGKLFGSGSKAPAAALPVVRDVTIGRTVVLDSLAWRRFGQELRFSLDRDTLVITAQGRIALDDGAFVHRFYTDDHVMLQAVSDDAEGRTANDFTVFVPWKSAYPASESARRVWAERLRAPDFHDEGLPLYRRFWFEGDDGDQPPVSFWEEVFDDRASTTPYSRLYQSCMLYSRDLAEEGRELLLAITLEPEKGDMSHEIMLGVPLQVGEFKA